MRSGYAARKGDPLQYGSVGGQCFDGNDRSRSDGRLFGGRSGGVVCVAGRTGLSEAELEKGLLCAGAVGCLLMLNSSVSGAEAGCQAEIGSASAMAAAAAVELMGGSPKMCLEAASLALSNLLGLVCDPIAGLVESPCQSRNAMGAANALTCAELALSGICHPIPFDEMASMMHHVGRSLPMELRETALGGCAATPTGRGLVKH